MQPIYDWFREFYERTGINLTFIYDDFDRARMVKGFFLTLELSVITIILSILIGIAGAWLQGSKLVWMRRIIAGFISVLPQYAAAGADLLLLLRARLPAAARARRLGRPRSR